MADSAGGGVGFGIATSDTVECSVDEAIARIDPREINFEQVIREINIDSSNGHLCPHGRQQYRCKDCGGASICIHGKRKQRCIECDGSEMCVHDKNKYYCKICAVIKASKTCEHGRKIHSCSACIICKEHKRFRPNCYACGGIGICVHDRITRHCRECKFEQENENRLRARLFLEHSGEGGAASSGAGPSGADPAGV